MSDVSSPPGFIGVDVVSSAAFAAAAFAAVIVCLLKLPPEPRRPDE